MNIMSIHNLFKGRKTTIESEEYYIHGSGLIRIPTARLNEIPKVVQEFHEREVARARLQRIAKH